MSHRPDTVALIVRWLLVATGSNWLQLGHNAAATGNNTVATGNNAAATGKQRGRRIATGYTRGADPNLRLVRTVDGGSTE